jgi:hypothetical protein
MNGVAQHWYYMLERDAGDVAAIPWPLFKALCHQRFGPPLGTNHLSDLARLPFRGTVADYQEAFLARMAHAGPLSPAQQVQLFIGGLPDPIRTNVELQGPTDLPRAMGLARAYERRNGVVLAAPAARPPRPSTRPQPLALPAATSPPPSQLTLAKNTPTPTRPFRRLSPTEMVERRRLGLCYNCDEQYVRGHKCPHFFYLEVTDFDDAVKALCLVLVISDNA